MINANTINKYQKKTVSQLLKIAQKHFNAWIRKRDEGQRCISCGCANTSHASHFYSAGHYPTLRFNEDNVHASCVKCNTFLSGNLNQYRRRLPDRIGQERLEKLDFLADADKRINHKWDRIYLIQIIEIYKDGN